jgi:hypothetical protein
MGFFKRLFARKPDPEKERAVFAELVRQRLLDATEGAEIELDLQNFSLRIRVGERVSVAFLHNHHAEYERAAPEDRPLCLERIVRQAGALDASELPAFAEARSQLRPSVRHRALLEFTRMQAALLRLADETVKFPEVVRSPFGEHLVLNLSYDMPETMMQVSASQLEEWQVDVDTAFEAAIEALAADTKGWFERIAPGVYASPWRDSYDASRLLLTEEVRRLPLRGDPVAIVPTRICTLIAGSDDIDGLSAMLEAAIEAQEEDRPVSLVPVRLYADGWRTFHPDEAVADEPRLAGFREARLGEAVTVYGQQKELLEQVMTDDVFVASLKAFGVDDRVGTTMAQWSEDVVTLLPECEKLGFFRFEGNKMAMVPWAVAKTVLADVLQPTEHWPPRYRVEGFPTEAQFEAMGARFSD